MKPVMNAFGRVLGYMDDSSSMLRNVRSINQVIVGYYNLSSNQTIRANGTVVGPGDLRLMLLSQPPG